MWQNFFEKFNGKRGNVFKLLRVFVMSGLVGDSWIPLSSSILKLQQSGVWAEAQEENLPHTDVELEKDGNPTAFAGIMMILCHI